MFMRTGGREVIHEDRINRSVEHIEAAGPDVFIHPSAVVEEGSVTGAGTRIWAGCHIMKGARTGRDCNLGEYVYMEAGAVLGDRVKVKNHIALYSGVICEDDVFLGPGCVFTNVINPRSFIERKQEFRQTIVKKGATIGANATIICGHTIGRYAMAGAGTVVTKDVPDYALVTGNPGKITGYVCECGCRLDGQFVCPACQKGYRMTAGVLSEKKERGNGL